MHVSLPGRCPADTALSPARPCSTACRDGGPRASLARGPVGRGRSSRQAAGLRCRSVAEVASSPALEFSRAQSEAEFFQAMDAAVSGGVLPAALVPGFKDFYNNYRTAVVGSGVPGSDERKVAEIMGSIADRVCVQFKDPYTFPSKHTRLLDPYDYYQFGQNYVRLLIDFQNSLLGGLDNFHRAAEALGRGENVVVLANHQTEADPAVWALLLEASEPGLATDVAYVAGDRVVTDPLCKPFSMGRNLFCVHSRKRMDDFPELREEKQRTNRRTVTAMVRALREGGQLLWVAPSGGRDRPSPEGAWRPAAFDPAVVGLIVGLLAGSKRPGHVFPLAMHSACIMPPPPATEKVLGERRLTSFAPVGMVLGEPLELSPRAATEEEQKAQEAQLSDRAFNTVTEQYTSLREAMRERAEEHRTPVGYVQPWLQ